MAALIAANDTQFGAPYVSPSNKTLMIDGLVNGAGAEINLTLAQANILNAAGVVTALNFMGGWKAWGNYTACYPVASDVKDNLIPVSRMFDWVANTVVQTCWSYIDQPMNRRTIDNILDTINISNANPQMRAAFLQEISKDVAAAPKGYQPQVSEFGQTAIQPS